MVDEALGPSHGLALEHGVYPHVLQLDYVLPSIEKEIGRDKLPVVFEYFGTDRGLKYWSETFDLFSTDSKALSNTTFLKENIMPIKESGQLNFIDKECEWLPGFEVLIVNGHTEGMMLPLIKYKDTKVLFCADLIPSAGHLPIAY